MHSYAVEVKMPCCGGSTEMMVELVERTCSCVCKSNNIY